MSVDTRSHTAFGLFLDDLPKALYVLVHLVMLVVGIAAWLHLRHTTLPHPEVILLYVVSQGVFLAFFANVITMKMAVLVEQMLILALVGVLALGVF